MHALFTWLLLSPSIPLFVAILFASTKLALGSALRATSWHSDWISVASWALQYVCRFVPLAEDMPGTAGTLYTLDGYLEQ